jgi:hypothetical protein
MIIRLLLFLAVISAVGCLVYFAFKGSRSHRIALVGKGVAWAALGGLVVGVLYLILSQQGVL